MKQIKQFSLSIVLLVFMFISINSCSNDASNNEMFANDSTLVAVVNGENITYDDIDANAKNMLIQNRIYQQLDYKDSLVQHESLEWLISNIVLKNEIANHTIEVLDEEVDRGIEIIKNNFTSEEEFLDALQSEGQTVRQLREQIVNSIKIRKMLDEEVFSKDMSVSDSEMKKFYDAHKDEFRKNERIRASHILVKVARKAPESAVRKARQKIEMIQGKIKNGEDFTSLAQDYSEDPSSKNGGDLGFFEKGDLLKEFDDTAFSLSLNETSEIIRTDLGFHIIKLTDTKKSQQIPFADVKDDVKNLTIQQKQDDALKNYIDKLKKQVDISVKENWYKN